MLASHNAWPDFVSTLPRFSYDTPLREMGREFATPAGDISDIAGFSCFTFKLTEFLVR